MDTFQSRRGNYLHPLHGILLSFPIALFTSALISDITYLNSAEIQWTNFSSWMITGGLVFGGLTLLWAAISLLRRKSYRGPPLLYLGLLAIMWVSGLINAFHHSSDAWSSVGSLGVTLSIISTLCALAAGWLAYRPNGGQ